MTKQLPMQDQKKISNLMAVGLNTELANKVVSAEYSLAKLKTATHRNLSQSFTKEVIFIKKNIKRDPLSSEIVRRLVQERAPKLERRGWKFQHTANKVASRSQRVRLRVFLREN